MFVSAETAKSVIKDLLAAAKDKAGSQNAFSKISGLNNATVWRASNGNGSFSAKALLSTIAYLGTEESSEIITRSLHNAAEMGFGTVGEYLNHYDKAVKIQQKKRRKVG